MSKIIKDVTPNMATLTIDSSDTLESEKWDENKANNVVASTESLADVIPIIETELKILKLFSGIEAEEKEIKILHKNDDNENNYTGREFRSPDKREYKKLLWTDSLWPCGGITFYFDVISQARPNDKVSVPDGYYIPKLKFIPVSKWAIPGCKLTADMIVYEPEWSMGADGVKRANVTFDVDVHLIKLAVFNWKSRIKFSIASDSTEIKLLSDPLPTPF